jgi:hypothetical protein
MQRSLKLSKDSRLMLLPEYVHTVFGLPYAGKEVWDSSLDKSPAIYTRVSELLSNLDKSEPPSKSAFRVLEKMVDSTSDSPSDKLPFLLCFIVYLMAVLLESDSPGSDEPTNFWPALLSEHSLSSFNWSSYFMESVISSCAQARRCVKMKQPLYFPPGVELFLQVSMSSFLLFMSFTPWLILIYPIPLPFV